MSRKGELYAELGNIGETGDINYTSEILHQQHIIAYVRFQKFHSNKWKTDEKACFKQQMGYAALVHWSKYTTPLTRLSRTYALGLMAWCHEKPYPPTTS